MATETHSNLGDIHKRQKFFAFVVISPLLFALVLAILLAVACLLPKYSRETEGSKEKRKKERLRKLDATIKVEHFAAWASNERRLHSNAPFCNVLCVICLEEFDDASQIRGLGCRHVFHQQCLDDWFARGNEYCPLCHRAIIPGAKRPPKLELNGGLVPPAASMA